MQILKWLRKDSGSLSARGKRQGDPQGQTVSRGWKLCARFCHPLRCSVVMHISTFLCPHPKPVNIILPGQVKGKMIPKCFIPLVCLFLCMFIDMASFSHPVPKMPGMFYMVHISPCI